MSKLKTTTQSASWRIKSKKTTLNFKKVLTFAM
jgi:hypothetical protein